MLRSSVLAYCAHVQVHNLHVNKDIDHRALSSNTRNAPPYPTPLMQRLRSTTPVIQ